MNNLNRYKLQNGITVLYRQNKNTPRTAVNVFFNSLNNLSLEAGVANVMSRLLLQGTKKHSAEEIADIIDNNGFEFNIDVKHDYIRLQTYFLDEDFDVASDLIDEVLKESTFEKVQKEISKLRGELTADLDSPRLQAFDNLAKNMFPNHYYGNTYTKILDNLTNVTKEKVESFYQNIFSADNIVVSVVSSMDYEKIVDKLDKTLGVIENKSAARPKFLITPISESKTVTIAKKNSAQAQIVQGWLAPKLEDEDFFAMSVMNTALGACGLSSRLLLELRDKKGLAYDVRSSYESLKNTGIFTIYIGTEPKNIQISLEGFREEIGKIQNTPLSEKELSGAKNNLLGKRKYYHETNSQQAYYLAYYEFMGLGAEFDAEIFDRIEKVSAEQVQAVAQKYLDGNSIISVLATPEYVAGL